MPQKVRQWFSRHHPWKSAAETGLLVIVGMTLFESLKRFIAPDIRIRESHTLTIALTTMIAL